MKIPKIDTPQKLILTLIIIFIISKTINTLTPQEPEPYTGDKTRNYLGTGNDCNQINFDCNQGWIRFHDKTGCGCEQQWKNNKNKKKSKDEKNETKKNNNNHNTALNINNANNSKILQLWRIQHRTNTKQREKMKLFRSRTS